MEIVVKYEIDGPPISNLDFSIYNFLLKKIEKRKENYAPFSLKEINRKLNIKITRDDLEKSLDSLHRNVVIQRFEHIYRSYGLISCIEKESGDFYRFFLISYIFRSLIGEDDRGLSMGLVEVLRKKSFSFIYTANFYDILGELSEKDELIYSLEELRKITKTERKYREYKEFKRSVLEKSLKELNELNEKYIYLFQEERLDRKVNKIRFTREEKKNGENLHN